MAPPNPPSSGDDAPSRKAHGDPWQAFGYVVAGVGFYGVVGYLFDRWLGTSFLVAIGVLVGAGLGIYLTLKTFGLAGSTPDAQRHAHDEHGTPRTEE